MTEVARRILYHYTTLSALTAILESQQLRPSLLKTRPRDVRYGEGQYLTDIPPNTMTSVQISRALMGRPLFAARFTHFLALDVTDLTLLQGRQGVFVVPNTHPLSLTGKIVKMGRNADDLPSS